MDIEQFFESSVVEDPLVKYSTKEKDGTLSPIIKSIYDYEKGETIEELIVRLFTPFYGFNEKQLFN